MPDADMRAQWREDAKRYPGLSQSAAVLALDNALDDALIVAERRASIEMAARFVVVAWQDPDNWTAAGVFVDPLHSHDSLIAALKDSEIRLR